MAKHEAVIDSLDSGTMHDLTRAGAMLWALMYVGTSVQQSCFTCCALCGRWSCSA